jgi:hypothetical protein
MNYFANGHSSEMDFIYVTTQSLTLDALKRLADEVGQSALCWYAAKHLSPACVSGQHRNSPNQLVGGCAGLPKKNRSISREASGPC